MWHGCLGVVLEDLLLQDLALSLEELPVLLQPLLLHLQRRLFRRHIKSPYLSKKEDIAKVPDAGQLQRIPGSQNDLLMQYTNIYL